MKIVSLCLKFQTFYSDRYKNQLLLNLCRTFSEQTFTKYIQRMLFKHFMYTVYQTFHDECLKNIYSKPFEKILMFTGITY